MSAQLDFLAITTPLPATSFGIEAVSGSETISRPFHYTARLHSGQALLDANALLDQSVTITVGGTTDGRYINGIVSAVRQLPSQSTLLWAYEITVVPKLWFLEQTSDCRFFQKTSVPDIVTGILGSFNVTCSNKLTATYQPLDYVVQFNESYLHFIQRILADAGIFYFFTHDNASHTMVLADANSAFPQIGQIYLDETSAGFGVLNDWHRIDRTALGSIRRDDYNPETDTLAPGSITGTETTVLTASAASQRTHYAWPAVRGTTSDAKTLATNQMLGAEVQAQLYMF
jgi:type VI secretion system secreted protein VgrG